MNKKVRMVIVGIMAIGVTYASTYAYFNNSTSVSNSGASTPLAMEITNGTVSITAETGTGGSTPYWTYDISRYKSDGSSEIVDSDYILRNRAIDLMGVGTDGVKEASDDAIWASDDDADLTTDIKRWKLGAPVKTAITKARPGDAFVMGEATGTDTKGLVIKNNSNLAVKIKLVLEDDKAIATFNALNAAGWKMYVGEKGGVDEFAIEQVTDKATLQTKLDKIFENTTLGNGQSVTLDVRLELPLDTDNTYQNDSLNGTSGVETITEFDINNLFTVVATQENNPGWGTDGSDDYTK